MTCGVCCHLYSEMDPDLHRSAAYSRGIVAPTLLQLIFNGHPGFFLGVHVVLVNRVLEETVVQRVLGLL